MANQVLDNRTGIATGETADPGGAGLWENLGGTLAVVDGEISYDTYTGSIGDFCTTTIDGTFWNDEAVGLFTSGDHAYFLINCGIVSLLKTKANSGVTFRVTGATAATDWAEVDLFGSDSWPSAFDGGWVQVVVDIDELLANPSRTGSTAPTVGNIQRAGFTFITATVMPRMADNFWVGGFAILPASTPALIIEGRDGGTTDWNWASVAAEATVQLSAVIKPGPGGSFVCRGPIRFGDSGDTTVHTFTDTDKIFLWDFQEVMLDGFYGFDAVGDSGAGTTTVTFGIKSGSGDAATGAQGGVIAADPAGARWFMDFNNADVTAINFYGAQLIHGGDLLLDSSVVSFISSTYLDCLSAEIHNSEQLRCKIIDAGTADGVAFMRTDDIADIEFCEFQFSDGHAIELDAATPTAQANKGNLFSGYTNSVDSTDAAIHNSAAGALAISSSQGSDLQTSSYRNTGGGSVVITNDIQITLNTLQNNTEISVYDAGDGSELAHVENVVGNTFNFTDSAANVVDIFIHHVGFYRADILGFTIPAADAAIPIQQTSDPNYVP